MTAQKSTIPARPQTNEVTARGLVGRDATTGYTGAEGGP